VTACGVRKLLAASNESPVTVCSVPPAPTRVPVTVTVTVSARTRLVFTALTYSRPSGARVAIASSTGTPVPSIELSKVGDTTRAATRSRPSVSL
jgi:hypothetical protein